MAALAPVDLASADGARAWVAAAVAAFGGVDILCNNASALRNGPLMELSDDEWFTIKNELDIVRYSVRAAWPELAGRAALFAAGSAALDGPAGPAVSDVRLLAPLHPASIRDSVSFEAHIEGARRSQEGATDAVPARWYEAPCFYFTNPHVCVGPFDDVERFPGSQLFDLELEVGVVYGEHGRNLTPEQAAAGIAGYTIFNDWSARDIQRLEGQLPFGFFKGKDGAHTLGPYLVTADELEPHRTSDGLLDLTMRAWINDELLGEDSLANCAFTWGRAGECVPPPLVPGDVVTLQVEGLGTVRNTIVEPAPCPPVPRARRGMPRGPRH